MSKSTSTLSTAVEPIGGSLSPSEPEVVQEYKPMSDEDVARLAQKMREHRKHEAELGEFDLAHRDPRFKYHFEVAGVRDSRDAVEKLLAKGWIMATDYEVGGKYGIKKARFGAKQGNHDFVVLKAPMEVIEQDYADQRKLAEQKLRGATANDNNTFNNTVETSKSAVSAGMLLGQQ